MLYLTLSSLESMDDGSMRCLCGAVVFPHKGAICFDCSACSQRWYALAPGLMLQQAKEAINAAHR